MTTSAGLRLARPSLADAAAAGASRVLDADQSDVVRRVVAGQDRALLVLGAPGSGRTTVALESVGAAVEAGFPVQEVLVLAPTRRAAAELQDRLAARLGTTTGGRIVRTPAAAAFSVLRARAALRGEPAPVLVSGPEQDLMLADLLAGHAAGDGVPIPWPPHVRSDVLGMRAFRDEVRDLLMRAAERGLAPEDLERLGREHGRAEWVAGAALYGEYLDVALLRASTPDAGERLDPAVVVEEAARALLTWDDEVPRAPRPRWRLVVVDDHQESTAATATLLRVLADDGARLLLTADPDEAVQTFRGATPALVGRAVVDGPGIGELGAETVVLRTVWRHGPEVRQVVARVAERVGTVGAAQHRRAGGHGPTGTAGVVLLPSAAQEAAYIAVQLRHAHLHDGVAWDDMAVVARTGAQVSALRRALAGASVPVAVAGSDVALRDEPAVRPLLEAMRVVLGDAPLDAAVASRLACSPLGGLDAVGLRRARRALRAAELEGGGGRPSDALLVEALAEGATPPRPLRRLAAVLDAGRAAAAEPDADAQTVLWALWDASGLAPAWQRSALAGGAAGDRADRDLDAVLALFRAAETFVDRSPRSRAAAFVDWLAAQDLPSDSIAARARRAAVPVLTPAGAAGREWDVVVVAGVQEGTWPDLRLRDSLLGAQALVDVVAGRAGASDDERGASAAREAVLHDELRSFAVACSRARRRLLVTAVTDTEHEPSPFVDLVQAARTEPDDRLGSAPAPLDLRGLVGQLRAVLEDAARRGEAPDPEAVATLGRLARHGAPGADPATWYGLAEPSTDEPLWADDERVPVSPSRIEAAARCALRWALESAGGSPAASAQQTLGTLIHSIAQEHPRGTREELAAALDRRWVELGLGEGWPARYTRRNADAMVARLADYLATAGEPVLLEASFRMETDRALVSGQVDRIERAPGTADAVRVVDLKTGKTAPPTGKVATNPQLGAYQLAVDAGAFDELPAGTTSAGAQLVYLGTGKAGTVRRQDALATADDPEWARTLVDEVAGSMAARSFAATVNDQCDRCPVRRSCPLRDEGGQVTE
ncbi:ATP-dependent helicase [Cellulomonas alba]|uniref:DNA 3'-5' helicase n=1 Tax=Cellulomonas alba TaxID=3053467 RepID=A0ABT7SF48_9CELL|nr:ATP-dependent DNA helicase [Cellulomonas alba]MDM7854192.1 ATP-dependent DNA helicase [Cellulomonas alba]